MKSLRNVLDSLPLSLRHWMVLGLRFSPGEHHTLSEIALRLEVTRERIRQIQIQAVRIIQDTWSTGETAILVHDLQSIPVKEELAYVELGNALKMIENSLKRRGWIDLCESDIIRLCIVVRARTNSSQPLLPIHEYICLLRPPIKSHSQIKHKVAEIAAFERARDRDLSYLELATQVLESSQQPLHWKEISRKAEELGRRRNFNRTSLYNMLSDKPEFTRTRPGTYGLTSWGISQAYTLVELIALVLHDAEQPLPFGAILREVRSLDPQPINANSVKMSVDLNVRFYYSKNDSYGLRAWLLPRHEQTLRTPEDFVETAKSFDRVRRAREDGYNVEAIVQKDIWDT